MKVLNCWPEVHRTCIQYYYIDEELDAKHERLDCRMGMFHVFHADHPKVCPLKVMGS